MKLIALLFVLAIGAFADSGIKEDSHIYDTVITHVKPEHWYNFKNELQKHSGFEAKHGIKVLGRYKPVAGGVGDLITLLQWDSMEQRVAKMKELFEDADFKAHHEKNAHFVDDITITTSKSSNLFEPHPPAPGSMLHIQKMHVKGFPRDAAQAFKEFYDAVYEKHMKPNGMKLVSVSRPIYGRNVQSYTVVWELTGEHPTNGPREAVKAIMADPTVQDKRAKIWENTVRRESYLVAPIAIPQA